MLWTIIVINLANAGFTLSLSEQFLLIALPNLVGSTLRIPYTFAVPRFGGRAVDDDQRVAAAHPRAAAGVRRAQRLAAEQSHATQMWVLALCAPSAGVGGGNFSSSMANISFFYPERQKGRRSGSTPPAATSASRSRSCSSRS